jgi:hypothetical protein
MAWAFYIVAMFIGFSLVAMFFLLSETKYRKSRLPLDHQSQDISTKTAVETSEDYREKANTIPEGAPDSPKIVNLISQLSLWPKPDPEVDLIKVFLRPFALICYPTVVWASLVYGVSLGWNVIIGATVAQLFGEPYGFDSQAQGLVFLSLFSGSLVGSWLSGWLADTCANYFTRKNDGIREPEMRLPTLMIGTVLIIAGTLMAGFTYHHHTHWAGPVVGLGVLTAGAQVGVSISMTYALDCHKEVGLSFHVWASY